MRKGTSAKWLKSGVRILEMLLVAVESIDAIGGLGFRKALVFGKGAIGLALAVLAHALVKRGEEEVLQDALVVGTGIRIEVDEDVSKIFLAEEAFRNEALLFKKPAEDDPGE